MADQDRLTRIESKLDRMGDAIVALARVEERTITMFNRINAMEDDRAAQSQRLLVVEGNAGTNGQALRFAERVLWIVVAAGVTYAFKTSA